MNDAIKMQISAFVDGELPENEAELLLRRLSHDRELRQVAASYLAMGRLLRSEHSLVGMERLRARIAAELEDRPVAAELDISTPANRRFLRPLAGVAIATSVALAAILGLRQTVGIAVFDGAGESGTVADKSVESTYTVPDQPDDLLRQYYLSHGETSSDFGANSVTARLVNLQLREGEIVGASPDPAGSAEADDEARTTAVEPARPQP
jgi:hypothetical protein